MACLTSRKKNFRFAQPSIASSVHDHLVGLPANFSHLLAIRTQTSWKEGSTTLKSKPPSIRLSNVLLSHALNPVKDRVFLSMPPSLTCLILGPSRKFFLSCMDWKHSARKSSFSLKGLRNHCQNSSSPKPRHAKCVYCPCWLWALRNRANVFSRHLSNFAEPGYTLRTLEMRPSVAQRSRIFQIFHTYLKEISAWRQLICSTSVKRPMAKGWTPGIDSDDPQ